MLFSYEHWCCKVKLLGHTCTRLLSFRLFMAFVTLYPEELALMFWSCDLRVPAVQVTAALMWCRGLVQHSRTFVLLIWNTLKQTVGFVLFFLIQNKKVYCRKCCLQRNDEVVSTAASQQVGPEFECPASLLRSFCVDVFDCRLPRCLRNNYQLWSENFIVEAQCVKIAEIISIELL